MEVVINICFGGFGLSDDAMELYKTRKNIVGKLYPFEIPRNDPVFVDIVKELDEKVNSRYSELKVISIPDDIEYTIEEFDGKEWVAEIHRTWS